MKLYEIPEESKIKVTVSDGSGENAREEMITFHHLDGMYSYCTTENGEAVHLSASTPMKKTEDYYEIDNEVL